MSLKPFDFQTEAVRHLSKQKSRLVGDDMGLGKTLTALLLDKVNRRELRKAKNYKGPLRTLIVCPRSTFEDAWIKTIQEVAPNAEIIVIDRKNRAPFIREATSNPGKNGYYIVHWAALRLMPELRKVWWFHIIADEVHHAKNRKAKQTRALKMLRTEYKTGLTGTPADDYPQDLWSILHWLWPTYYRSYWKFFNDYVVSVKVTDKEDENRNTGYHKVVGVKNVEHLQKEIKPFFIRRLKDDVLKELPPKTYSIRWVDLKPEQRRAYNQMRNNMIAWIGQQEDTPIVAPVVVAMLTRLQQFALAYMQELEDGSYQLTEPSSKLDELMCILQEHSNQLVVFTSSVQMINLASNRLDNANVSHVVYTGSVKDNLAKERLKAFQQGKVQVFLASIAFAYQGINLQNSSTSVFLDRTWKHTWNKQAEDRQRRLGQTSAVQVIDIMARDTVDAVKRDKVELKWSWVREMLGDISSGK